MTRGLHLVLVTLHGQSTIDVEVVTLIIIFWFG